MNENVIKIQGMGIVSSLGKGRSKTVEKIQLKKHGMSPLTIFPNQGIENIPVCQIPDFPANTTYRCDKMAMVAILEALEEAGLPPSSKSLNECALVLGITTVDLLEWEDKFRNCLVSGVSDPSAMFGQGAVAGRVAIRLADKVGIKGPVLTYNTGCTSSASALYQGMQLLWTNKVKRVLAVGVDSLTATSLYGFASLALLDPDGCHPFDKNRKGLQMGEGAAAILIEKNDTATITDDSVQPQLLSGISTCDTYHPTASSPDGSGGARAMEAAIQRAGIKCEDIEGIKIHGAGSQNNDLAEGRALHLTFGAKIPPFVSLKRYFGHTMGACGILEIVAFISCIHAGFIPATLGYSLKDPDIKAGPITDHRVTTGGFFLLNYFGFGGSCVSLVIRVNALE